MVFSNLKKAASFSKHVHFVCKLADVSGYKVISNLKINPNLTTYTALPKPLCASYHFYLRMKASRIIIRTVKFRNAFGAEYALQMEEKQIHNFHGETRHLEGQDVEAM
jgi:hypothetical protein